jgi:hypothetical protein
MTAQKVQRQAAVPVLTMVELVVGNTAMVRALNHKHAEVTRSEWAKKVQWKLTMQMNR